MQTKITVGGVEYVVSPIPPNLAPYQALVEQLMRKTPATIEEAETIASQLEAAVGKILFKTVKPTPTSQDASEVFKAVQDVTVKAVKDAGLFRDPCVEAKPDNR